MINTLTPFLCMLSKTGTLQTKIYSKHAFFTFANFKTPNLTLHHIPPSPRYFPSFSHALLKQSGNYTKPDLNGVQNFKWGF